MKLFKPVKHTSIIQKQFALVLVVSAAVVFGPGLTANAQLPVTNGLALWLDASQLTGLADGQQVNTWTRHVAPEP